MTRLCVRYMGTGEDITSDGLGSERSVRIPKWLEAVFRKFQATIRVASGIAMKQIKKRGRSLSRVAEKEIAMDTAIFLKRLRIRTEYKERAAIMSSHFSWCIACILEYLSW